MTLFQQAVDDVLVDGDRVTGVLTQMGLVFRTNTIVLTVGPTFRSKPGIYDNLFAINKI